MTRMMFSTCQWRKVLSRSVATLLLCHIPAVFPARLHAQTAPSPIPHIPPGTQFHAHFDFKADDLARHLIHLPETALAQPELFLELASEMLEMPAGVLELVDKTHALQETFVPEPLVRLTDYPDISLSVSTIKLIRPAAESLAAMSRQATLEGVSLPAVSAYRSWNYQRTLFAQYSRTEGLEAALQFSAQAGHSQHQLGTAVDFGDITNAFAQTEAGLWMQEHAASFGWSLSYPEGQQEVTGFQWESWHWRWLGTAAVRMQHMFFQDSQQQLLEFWHQNREILQRARSDSSSH